MERVGDGGEDISLDELLQEVGVQAELNRPDYYTTK